MNIKEDISLTNELVLEIISLKRAIHQIESNGLSGEEVSLSRRLNEYPSATEEEVRQIIKEALIDKKNTKELSNEQLSSKIPVFFSQPKQEEETEYEEISDLNSLVQRATSGVIKLEALRRK